MKKIETFNNENKISLDNQLKILEAIKKISEVTDDLDEQY